MKKMNEKREKSRKAAIKRWYKGCQNDTFKEKKEKEKNEISDPPVLNLEKM